MEGKNVYKVVCRKNHFPFNRVVGFTNANSGGEVLESLNRERKDCHLEDIQFIFGEDTTSEVQIDVKPRTLLKKVLIFIKDLFMEKGQWSLARISFAIILGFVIRSLLTVGGDIPAGVLQLVGILLGYIFLGKTPLNTLIDSNYDGIPDITQTESDMPTQKGTP